MLIFLQIQNPAIGPGSGTFTSHSFEIILICLVMFLMGWFLHHVIFCSRHKKKISELEGNLKSARTRINDLEGDLESCNAAVINLKGENANLSSKIAKLEREGVTLQETSKELPVIEMEETRVFIEDNPIDDAMIAGLATDLGGDSGKGFDANAARAVFGKHIMEDDLQVLGVYDVTKSALIHLTKQLAPELGPKVRVNAICPGLIKTDFARMLWEGERGDEVAAEYPLGRLGEVEDIAAAALWLAADSGSWITGQAIVLDGGGLVQFRT